MKKSIQIQRTAHYHLMGNENADHLLIVIHGYAQLAEEFIQDFKALERSNILIAAPEGISKFYNKEKKAVANWMTSHEREDEMKDYINYLETLNNELCKEYGIQKVSVLGFSQGTSTSLRWVSKTKQSLQHVLVCSGAIPPELKKEDFDGQKDCQFHYFYGDDDRFFTAEQGKGLFLKLSDLAERVDEHPFSGGHIIHDSTVQFIAENLS